MKILNESKEQLPISFITDFVSQGWNTVGDMKENITAISKAFSGTEKVEAILQELIDAYLICIGQMEAYLDKKDYIDYPEEIGQEMKELAVEDKTDQKKIKPIEKVNDEDNIEKTIPAATLQLVELDDDAIFEEEPKKHHNHGENDEHEPFAYFVDFDEPDMSTPKLTDDDIYGKQNLK